MHNMSKKGYEMMIKRLFRHFSIVSIIFIDLTSATALQSPQSHK